ncbi:DMT family transporter [Candidatus Colwellia aromaticivorans]|uniref:DMT family transporter n=1 Tax=Candidatus Colwellia aromaticivorans TaxID=2267621 RepID=UPI000DF20600|nr:DMT family transporter [Candidatus Colwellia aromaticivorans]
MTSKPSNIISENKQITSSFGVRMTPVFFVWLWSTGFIGAKYGLPYAEPFILLFYRMLITLVCLGFIALWIKSSWPSLRSAFHMAVSGLLIHGFYLGGVFYAIAGDMPAGLVSLIVGLQPLVTTMAAIIVLKERVVSYQWLGLLLGLLGVGLVLFEKLGGAGQLPEFPLWTLGCAFISLIGISLGTVYQKRFGDAIDLIPGAFIQYCAAALLFALGTFLFESQKVEWNMQLMLAMGWLVLGLSIGAILLLMQLINQGAASEVASLFYLVPPVTAIEAYILFDEQFEFLALCGGVMSVFGVALVLMAKRSGSELAQSNSSKTNAIKDN